MRDARSPEAQSYRGRGNGAVDNRRGEQGDLAPLDEWDQNGHHEGASGTIEAPESSTGTLELCRKRAQPRKQVSGREFLCMWDLEQQESLKFSLHRWIRQN